jgi:uncharacterized membrane protein required for colicin V production
MIFRTAGTARTSISAIIFFCDDCHVQVTTVTLLSYSIHLDYLSFWHTLLTLYIEAATGLVLHQVLQGEAFFADSFEGA